MFGTVIRAGRHAGVRHFGARRPAPGARRPAPGVRRPAPGAGPWRAFGVVYAVGAAAHYPFFLAAEVKDLQSVGRRNGTLSDNLMVAFLLASGPALAAGLWPAYDLAYVTGLFRRQNPFCASLQI